MSKLVRFPNLREAREEASLWVVRLDRGLTPEERVALREWSSSPLNRRALRELTGLWNDLDKLQALAEVFPKDAPRVRPTRRLRWMAAAAAVALAAVGGLLWMQRPSTPAVPAAAQVAEVRTLATPIGERRTVDLEDGSAVTLNTDTELSVVFTPGHRDLRLSRGEAHFQVAHDAAKPFRVFVGERLVEAVGTAFSVRLRESGELEVMVTEGAVRVQESAERPGAQPQLVAAQQLLQVDGQGQPHLQVVPPVEMDIRLAWQRGMLIFQGEALAEVLAEFDRYTHERLVIADPRLRAVRVGGYFRAGDVDALLIALRENFQIRSKRDADGQILLTSAE